MIRSLLLVACFFVAACGGSGESPTAPSQPPIPTPTPPPPAPVTLSLSGTVSAQSGARLSGASVQFLDGPNAGRSTSTDANGSFRFDGLTAGNTNVAANAPDYEESRRGLTLTSNSTIAFTLRTAAPWTQSGTGNTVFDLPTQVSRVRIQASYTGTGSNFIAWCGSQLVVNEILGTRWPSTTYEGTHLIQTRGCAMRIENSTGVSWTFTEVR